MSFLVFLGLGVLVVMVLVFGSVFFDPEGKSSISQDLANRERGFVNPHMECPHCRQTGHVRTKSITQKKGVSGAKATAAIITGGVSLVATGLSRKEASTQANCDHCRNTWVF